MYATSTSKVHVHEMKRKANVRKQKVKLIFQTKRESSKMHGINDEMVHTVLWYLMRYVFFISVFRCCCIFFTDVSPPFDTHTECTRQSKGILKVDAFCPSSPEMFRHLPHLVIYQIGLLYCVCTYAYKCSVFLGSLLCTSTNPYVELSDNNRLLKTNEINKTKKKNCICFNVINIK